MLIPEMDWDEFNLLNSDEIMPLKSHVITKNGKVVFFAIIPPTNGGATIYDRISTQAEYLGAQGNSVGGIELTKTV